MRLLLLALLALLAVLLPFFLPRQQFFNIAPFRLFFGRFDVSRSIWWQAREILRKIPLHPLKKLMKKSISEICRVGRCLGNGQLFQSDEKQHKTRWLSAGYHGKLASQLSLDESSHAPFHMTIWDREDAATIQKKMMKNQSCHGDGSHVRHMKYCRFLPYYDVLFGLKSRGWKSIWFDTFQSG